jgi:hypothetical protein
MLIISRVLKDKIQQMKNEFARMWNDAGAHPLVTEFMNTVHKAVASRTLTRHAL